MRPATSLLDVMSDTYLLCRLTDTLDLASLGRLRVVVRHFPGDFWQTYYNAGRHKAYYNAVYAPMLPKIQHPAKYGLKVALCVRGVPCPLCFLNANGQHTRSQLAQMSALSAGQLPPNEYLLWLALHSNNRLELSRFAEWRCLAASCFWDQA